MLIITNESLKRTGALVMVLPTDVLGNKDIKITNAMTYYKRIKWEFKRKSIPKGLNKRATKAYIASITHYHFRLGDGVKLTVSKPTKNSAYTFSYICILPLFKDITKSERKDLTLSIRKFSYKYKELMFTSIAFPALELIGESPQASTRRTNMLIDSILETRMTKDSDIYIHVPMNMLNVIEKRMRTNGYDKKLYRIEKINKEVKRK